MCQVKETCLSNEKKICSEITWNNALEKLLFKAINLRKKIDLAVGFEQ